MKTGMRLGWTGHMAVADSKPEPIFRISKHRKVFVTFFKINNFQNNQKYHQNLVHTEMSRFPDLKIELVKNNVVCWNEHNLGASIISPQTCFWSGSEIPL